jgi:hypothetical protein
VTPPKKHLVGKIIRIIILPYSLTPDYFTLYCIILLCLMIIIYIIIIIINNHYIIIIIIICLTIIIIFILFCPDYFTLMPDNFTCQGGSAGTHWVKGNLLREVTH